MDRTNNQNKTKQVGSVRIRSNVCTSENDWHLVPGDIMKKYGDIKPRTPQHDEMMYNEPCCICKRTQFQIEEEGCDKCRIPAKGTAHRSKRSLK